MDESTQLQSRQRVSSRIQRNIDDAVRDPEESQTLWNRARMFARSITDRYSNSNIPLAVYESDLHDLWYMIIEAAKITPADDAAMDRLTAQVLYIREFGHLTRIASADPSTQSESITSRSDPNQQVEPAITTDGQMWVDLPFLVLDLRAVWKEHMTMPILKRHNLAAFTARLTALGVRSEDLSVCALWTFRDTLEIERDIIPADNANKPEIVTVADLLPTVAAWLWYSGHKLLSFCARDVVPDVTLDTSPGSKASIITEAGFGMKRWYFWKEEFARLSRHQDEDVAENGRKCAHMMERWEEIIGGRDHDRELARTTHFDVQA